MAGNNEDNTRLNLAHTQGSIYADEAIEEGGQKVKYQKIKMVHGAPGVNDGPVSTANPFPVGLYDGSGNAISSLNGAIDVHNADVHTDLVNKLMRQETATTTTLTAATASDGSQYTIDVADSTGFLANDYIEINTGSVETTLAKIISINNATGAATFTLDRRMDISHSIGDTVTKVAIDMSSQAGTMASPQEYYIKPQAGEVWHITRVLFELQHTTAGDNGLFGDLDALTNGVILRKKVSGQYTTITNWKTNSNMKTDMFDVEYDTRSGGGGAYGTTGRYTFLRSGAIVRLDGDNGDMLEVCVQDDITGLDSFTMKVQGHPES